MSLHRYSQEEQLNLRLRSGMRNWLVHKRPPAGIRAQLLKTAAGEVIPTVSLISRVKNLSWDREYTTLSFERFAKATAYSLQIGILIV